MALRVPENPVKLISRIPVPYKDTVSDPALTLTLIELASVPPAVPPNVNVRVPVLPEYVRLAVGVPVTTRPVELSVFQTAPPFPVTAMRPVPKAIVRVFVLLELNTSTVSVDVPRDRVPEANVKPPVKVGEPVRDKVMSDLLTEQDEVVAVAATDTTAAVPLLASNVTVSAVVGADAPPAPPEVADQLVVEVLFQVPDPPTQNRAAIYRSLRLKVCAV